MKACAFIAKHRVPPHWQCLAMPCTALLLELRQRCLTSTQLLLVETLSSGSESSHAESCSAGGAAQLSDLGVLPTGAGGLDGDIRTHIMLCPRMAMSTGLDLNPCGQMKAAAHPARKVKQDILELVIFWFALEMLLFSCQCDFSPGPLAFHSLLLVVCYISDVDLTFT